MMWNTRMRPLAAALLLLAGSATAAADLARELDKAEQLRAQGQLGAAIIELKNALQDEPDYGPGRRLLGVLYVELGNGAEAEKELLRARRLKVRETGIALPLAEALLLQREYQRLLESVQPVSGMSMRDVADLRALRGEALLALGRQGDAEAAVKSALATDPAAPRAQIAEARLALAARHPDTARQRLQTVLSAPLPQPVEHIAQALLGDVEIMARRLPEAAKAYDRAIATGRPHQALAIQLKRGLLRIDLGDPDGARADLGAVNARLPDLPLPHFGFGLLAYRQGRYADALDSFERALQRDHENPDIHAKIAATRIALGQREQAVTDLEKFLQEHPDSDPILRLLATIRLQQGDTAGAQKLLRHVLELHPDDNAVLDMLGAIALARGEAREGEPLLRRSVERDPDSAAARYRLGLGLLALGDRENGLRELAQATQLQPGQERYEYALALGLLRSGQHAEAVAAAQRLQALWPDRNEPLLLEGIARASALDTEGASAAFERVLARSPGDPAASGGLATLDLQQGRPDKARSRYRAVLEQHPGHGATLLELAALELRLDNPEAARRALEQAVAADPEALEPRLRLARLLGREGRHAAALELLEAVHARHADDVQLIALLGAAKTALGDAGGGRAAYRRLLDLDPKSATGLYGYASACAAGSDDAGLRAALRPALAADPGNALAQALLARLQELAPGEAAARAWFEELNQALPDNLALLEFEGRRIERQQGRQPAAIYYGGLRRRQPHEQLWALREVELWQQAKEPAQARSVLVDWLRWHPDDDTVRARLAAMMLAAGQNADAKAELERIVADNPTRVSALNNLAWLLRKDDPRRALRLAERAVRLRPEPRILETLGEVLIAGGEYVRATEVLQYAALRAPQQPSIRYQLAVALAGQQRKEDARRLLKELLAGDTRFAERSDAAALLKKLGG